MKWRLAPLLMALIFLSGCLSARIHVPDRVRIKDGPFTEVLIEVASSNFVMNL